MKVLNLYAGLGGNRKFWENVEVTAIETQENIAEVYQNLYPNDKVLLVDAHDYLLNNHQNFHFVWSSPPCQTHTKMIRSGKNRKPTYADLRLYEEIMLLEYDFKGRYVVENVKPYYSPLIEPTTALGRHLFWSNFPIDPGFDIPQPKGFINNNNVRGSNELKEWLGIWYDGNIYYGKNHSPSQVLRNCVHPKLGEYVFNEYLRAIK